MFDFTKENILISSGRQLENIFCPGFHVLGHSIRFSLCNKLKHWKDNTKHRLLVILAMKLVNNVVNLHIVSLYLLTWVWLLALMDPLEDPHPEAGGNLVVPAVHHFPLPVQQIRGELQGLVQLDVLRFILEPEYYKYLSTFIGFYNIILMYILCQCHLVSDDNLPFLLKLFSLKLCLKEVQLSENFFPI